MTISIQAFGLLELDNGNTVQLTGDPTVLLSVDPTNIIGFGETGIDDGAQVVVHEHGSGDDHVLDTLTKVKAGIKYVKDGLLSGEYIPIRELEFQVDFYDQLDDGERALVDWQYMRAGDFVNHLFQLFCAADCHNIRRLSEGFPNHARAYNNYSNVVGWWEEIQNQLYR